MNDKIASYERMKDVIFRFPNCTFITFETVGHLLVGHEQELEKSLNKFIKHTIKYQCNIEESSLAYTLH